MRYALPLSALIHVVLIGGAWYLINQSSPPEETGVDSVAVDIVSLEEFASTETSTAVSSATESLVAAGAEAAEPSDTVEPIEEASIKRLDTAKVTAAEAAQPQAAQPMEVADLDTTETSSLAVMSALPMPSALPVEGLIPVTPSPTAAAVEMVAPQVEVPIEVAAIRPQAAKTSELEALEPVAETQPDLVAPKPLPRPDFKKEAMTPTKEAEPRKAEPEKPQAKEAEKKPTEKEKPDEQPRKKPQTAGGNGGNSNANVAAAAASGAKGRSESSGNASVSKYPGLVQRALRRALRMPKGSARGEVHISFVVSAAGKASGITVSRSSGHAALDKEAMATVKRAKFPPIPADAGRSSWSFTIPLAFER